MRERTHLSDSIGAYKSLERELDDALPLAELGESEGDTASVKMHVEEIFRDFTANPNALLALADFPANSGNPALPPPVPPHRPAVAPAPDPEAAVGSVADPLVQHGLRVEFEVAVAAGGERVGAASRRMRRG